MKCVTVTLLLICGLAFAQMPPVPPVVPTAVKHAIASSKPIKSAKTTATGLKMAVVVVPPPKMVYLSWLDSNQTGWTFLQAGSTMNGPWTNVFQEPAPDAQLVTVDWTNTGGNIFFRAGNSWTPVMSTNNL